MANIDFPGFKITHENLTPGWEKSQKGSWCVRAYPRLGSLSLDIFTGDSSGVNAAGHDAMKIKLESYEQCKTALAISRQADREDWDGLTLFEVLSGKTDVKTAASSAT